MHHRTVAIIGAIALLCVFAFKALARDNGQYANVDSAVREWYRTRQLTPAAQERFLFKSCCDGADVYRTRFKVASDGTDQWLYDENGKWLVVPADIIHFDEHSPTGEPVLFVVAGKPVCFFPPAGGG